MIPLGLKETKEVDFTVSIQVRSSSPGSFKVILFDLDNIMYLYPQKYLSAVILLLISCLSVCLLSQDFICEHYGEDSSLYDKEIKELMELRQVHKFTRGT